MNEPPFLDSSRSLLPEQAAKTRELGDALLQTLHDGTLRVWSGRSIGMGRSFTSALFGGLLLYGAAELNSVLLVGAGVCGTVALSLSSEELCVEPLISYVTWTREQWGIKRQKLWHFRDVRGMALHISVFALSEEEQADPLRYHAHLQTCDGEFPFASAMNYADAHFLSQRIHAALQLAPPDLMTPPQRDALLLQVRDSLQKTYFGAVSEDSRRRARQLARPLVPDEKTARQLVDNLRGLWPVQRGGGD